MKALKLFSLCIAVLFAAAAAEAELLLADNGKTDYQVVNRIKKASRGEKAAARDLRTALRIISKADFTTAVGKKYQIIIGEAAPSDKRPLKNYERRIVSENGNIHIWGQGKYGNINAVYDFLKDVMGCRWFTVSGDRRMPRQQRIELDDLNISLIPSIPQVTVNQWATYPAAINYARRNHFISSKEDTIGPFSHPARRIIPCGEIPLNGKEGVIRGPWPCFKDKAYFKTNPEFFAIGKDGKRTRKLQLCYSNSGLREEIRKNILIMLKDQQYKGGVAHVGLGHDDHGGKFCYCKDCQALEEKYDHPAGAYFDYIIYIANCFAKTHPELLFHFSAYREEQTLRPPSPDRIKAFPPNVLPGYAPLSADFSKPLTHPANKLEAELFRQWGKIAPVMRWSVYPSTYPRPTVNLPLTANIHRLLENTDFAYANNTRRVYAEFGLGPYEALGFGDLRAYVLFEKFRKIDSDEKVMIREFSDTCYGKAAPAFRRYLAELEEKELNFPKYMRWNPDLLLLNYCTAGNLLRWSADFDKMEKAVGKNRRHLLNLRRARYALDQTIVLWWPEMTKAEQAGFGDLDTYINRCRQTVRDHANDLFASERNERSRNKLIESRVNFYEKGFVQLVAAAKGGKDLPEFFKGKKLWRIIPNRNKMAVDNDPEAAFGLSVTGKYPETGELLLFRSYDHDRDPAWMRHNLPKPLTVARVEKAGADGQLRWYHLGSVTLKPDCQVMFPKVWASSGYSTTQCFDEKNPNRLFDLYVCMSADKAKRKIRFDQMVVVRTERIAAAGEIEKGVAGSVDEIDMFH